MLLDLYRYVERPLTIVRITEDVFCELIENYPGLKALRYRIHSDIISLVDKEIAGDARALAVFILALFRELPEANISRMSTAHDVTSRAMRTP
ncbi:MAG: hypothetical protein QOI58_3094 [Thermoanaerobaculia bacterium]|jgi:hypothetical protein|nr:hypothetical protein [Thermoanaerobaculia bacterium]